jgi:hypothetical protein
MVSLLHYKELNLFDLKSNKKITTEDSVYD